MPSTIQMIRPTRPLSEREQKRFWSKVALPNGEGCMLWTGARNSKGYGQLRVDDRAQYVHRLSYVLAYGPIPDGLVLDHVCVTPACVRPDHLEAVTQAENMRRYSVRKTHCKRGHAFGEKNTYIRKDTGARMCRPCKNIRTRQAACAAQNGPLAHLYDPDAKVPF